MFSRMNAHRTSQDVFSNRTANVANPSPVWTMRRDELAGIFLPSRESLLETCRTAGLVPLKEKAPSNLTLGERVRLGFCWVLHKTAGGGTILGLCTAGSGAVAFVGGLISVRPELVVVGAIGTVMGSMMSRVGWVGAQMHRHFQERIIRQAHARNTHGGQSSVDALGR